MLESHQRPTVVVGHAYGGHIITLRARSDARARWAIEVRCETYRGAIVKRTVLVAELLPDALAVARRA